MKNTMTVNCRPLLPYIGSMSRHWPVWVMLYAIFGLVPLMRASLECSTRYIVDDPDLMAPKTLRRTKANLRKKHSSNAPIFELAMPFCGKSNTLFEFSERLGHSLSTLQSNVQMKLLLTKCIDDDHLSDDKFLELLEDLAGGISIETVSLDIKGADFSRGFALNALTERACSDPGCYFAVVDVDMDVKPSFIENTISFVKSNKTIYYPIVFSEYEPSSVIAAETIFGKLEPYDAQAGQWRKWGWGMLAAYGEAVHSLKVERRLDSKWGGEDGELKNQATRSGFTIVREQEPGLVHRWHPKLCTSEFVEASYLPQCRDARDRYSGSPFLRGIRERNQKFFDYLVYLPASPKRSFLVGTEWVARTYMAFQKNQDDFKPEAIPKVGDMISYWYDWKYGYQLGTVVEREVRTVIGHQDDREDTTQLTIEFFIDEGETETLPYEPVLVNAHDTSSFKDCSQSRHPSSSNKNPSATVSCRQVHYKAPPKLSFEKSGKVMVGVLSAAKNRGRRNLIRKTWANPETRKGIFFVVSGPWEDIEEEYREHQDLIWIEGEEDFLLITYKTAMFVQVVNAMANELGLNYTHVLKTDDDSYVAIERLERFLEGKKGIDYFGLCGHYSRPKRDPDHKYYVSKQEYPKDFFPPYCQGGAIVLSRNMVECAAIEMEKTMFLSMEDVYLGMVAERCGIVPTRAEKDKIMIQRPEEDSEDEDSGDEDSENEKDAKIVLRPKPASFADGKLVQHHIIDDKDMEAHHAALMQETNKSDSGTKKSEGTSPNGL